jgi:hypothetical protein
MDLIQGRTTPDDVMKQYGLTAEELERWQQRFLEGAEQALDPASQRNGVALGPLRDLYAKIGAQAMQIEDLRKLVAKNRPAL